MDTAQSPPRPPKIDVGIGLVQQAWRDRCSADASLPATPTAVTPLKSQRAGRKSGVYRLEGVGVDGSNVVAKRCLRSIAVVERYVYERLLPHIDLPSLRYYGSLDERGEDYCCIFLEDAGDEKLVEGDEAFAARWLARLHTSAAALSDRVTLPDCGPDRYLSHLRTGRELLDDVMTRLAPRRDDWRALEGLRRTLDELESHWDSLSSACDAAPRTLVHGDFARKNLRVRAAASGRELIALDWETAGWGPPAADLAFSPIRNRNNRPPRPDRPRSWGGTVSLEEYAACSHGLWYGRRNELERLAKAGTLFRSAASVRWAAEQALAGATRGVERLRWCATLLPRAILEFNC